jgi:hypothetical protein
VNFTSDGHAADMSIKVVSEVIDNGLVGMGSNHKVESGVTGIMQVAPAVDSE